MSANVKAVGCRWVARRGFSMVELLTVIGILAVLLMILLPGVNRARRQSKATTCANQLRQIHTASQVWKVKFDPAPLSAFGWRTAYAPLVEDIRIFNCTESLLVEAGVDDKRTGDKAAGSSNTSRGGTSGAAGGAAGGSGSTGSGTAAGGAVGGTAAAPAVPAAVSDLYVHVDRGGSSWDVPVKDGPWWKKSNVTGGSYDMWLEDQGGNGGGDRDFMDIGVRITDNSDGSVTVQLLPLAKGLPGYTASVMATNPNGGPPVTVIGDAYRTPASQAGAKKTLDGPFNPGTGTNGGGTSNANGDYVPGSNQAPGSAPGGTGAAGGSAADIMPGYATASDYGMNENVRLIDGDGSKIYMMDYTWSVIRPLDANENWAASKWKTPNGKTLKFARHQNLANVLYGDGSVRPEKVSDLHMNPAASGTNYLDYWAGR